MDFLTFHGGFCDPDTVLQDNITLYTITPSYAVFVETDSETDVTDMKEHPFLKVAQHELATRLIVLPTNSFHKLADHIGRPKAKLILMANTMRCGSTLMCQIFQRTNKCVALSEPDMEKVLQMNSWMKKEECDRTTVSIINLLCKPRASKPQAYMLKVAGPSIGVLPILHALYPESSLLFMYREGTQMALSCARIAKVEPSTKLAWAIISLLGPQSLKYLIRMSDYSEADLNHQFETTVPFIGFMMWWADLCSRYRRMRKQGLPISAIKYEHIVNNPQHALKEIFKYCDLDLDLVTKALEALQDDSQGHSILSQHNLRQYETPEMTPDTRLQIHQIFDYAGIPRPPKPCVLDGTLTV